MLGSWLSQHGYYLFLSIGAVSMLCLMLVRRSRFNMSWLSATLFTVILLACGISGAKLLFFIESGFTSFSGMSFFGAVFMVGLVMPLIGLLFRLHPSQSLDACAPCVASILGFTRFGCYSVGCCGGLVCTLKSTTFIWPTQLIEGFGDMAILALLLYLERDKGHQGSGYPVWLTAYGVLRFFVEFLRDTPKLFFGMSEGQWLALLSLAIGSIILFIYRKTFGLIRQKEASFETI